jgi:hypothetical protein
MAILGDFPGEGAGATRFLIKLHHYRLFKSLQIPSARGILIVLFYF